MMLITIIIIIIIVMATVIMKDGKGRRREVMRIYKEGEEGNWKSWGWERREGKVGLKRLGLRRV